MMITPTVLNTPALPTGQCKASCFCSALVTCLLLLSLHAAEAASATWSLNPVSGDWNTAANWMPNTVPNGPTGIATFDVSNTTEISLSANTTVSAAVFDPGASPFTVTVPAGQSLTFTGAGATDNSGIIQNFIAEVENNGTFGTISFTSDATARELTVFTARGADSVVPTSGGVIKFLGNSNASNGLFINEGSTGVASGRTSFSGTSSAGSATFTNKTGGGLTQFLNSATAGNGTFTVEGGTNGLLGGAMTFTNTASAGNGTFVIAGSSNTSGLIDPAIDFFDSSTADQATFTIKAGTVAGAVGGRVSFIEESTAADATFTVNGSAVSGAEGGQVVFGGDNLTAGNATVILNGGQNGGEGALCSMGADRDAGGTPRMEIFGNATLLVVLSNNTGISVGSIEGDGLVSLGSRATVITGGNNLSTVFSGVIQQLFEKPANLQKTGTGTLTLTGANNYTGVTTLDSGALLISNTTGSGTGTGTVTVNAGTLGGKGIISGAVTVGTGSSAGAFLAPAFGSNEQVTLTLQSSLTLQADATYIYTFKARRNQSRTDLVIANGVTINGATTALQGTTQGRLRQGTVYTVISNTSANPISGAFSNLAGGAIVNVNGNNLQASYSGGDGNDLTLTVVP